MKRCISSFDHEDVALEAQHSFDSYESPITVVLWRCTKCGNLRTTELDLWWNVEAIAGMGKKDLVTAIEEAHRDEKT
jgi:hypothetical protein